MAIKAQALADFIVKFTYFEEDNTLDAKVDLAIEREARENVGDATRWKLFMDGSSNQHSCDAGLILRTPSSDQMEYAIHIGFKATNNESEYEALLAGLIVMTELGVESLDIYSDSQLVLN